MGKQPGTGPLLGLPATAGSGVQRIANAANLGSAWFLPGAAGVGPRGRVALPPSRTSVFVNYFPN